MVSGPVLTKAEAGYLGARKRWGEPRVVRLDSLSTEQRRLVLALIEAARSAPSTTHPVDEAA